MTLPLPMSLFITIFHDGLSTPSHTPAESVLVVVAVVLVLKSLKAIFPFQSNLSSLLKILSCVYNVHSLNELLYNYFHMYN